MESEDFYRKAFVRNLTRERLRRQMNYRQFGECVGIHFQLLYQYENKKIIPNMVTLIKLAHGLNMSMEKLVGYKNER